MASSNPGDIGPPPRIGDFQLLDKLGCGTYASVYRCYLKESAHNSYSVFTFVHVIIWFFLIAELKGQGVPGHQVRGQVEALQVVCGQYHHRDSIAEDPETPTHRRNEGFSMGRQVMRGPLTL